MAMDVPEPAWTAALAFCPALHSRAMRDFIASENSERLRRRISSKIRIREPAAFAKLAGSTFDMALVTGIVARLYRAVILTRDGGWGGDGRYFAVAYTVGAVFLLLMATLHLNRFPLRQWVWRAPAFAAVVAAVEMIVSLALIAMNREPLGSGVATWADWPGLAIRAIVWRVLTVSAFAVVLAVAVKWIRYMLLRREHAAWSPGTVRADSQGEGFVERRRPR